jgi:ABC-type nitrate/sulfonate/bicarbonate transport system substrate-binding protein
MIGGIKDITRFYLERMLAPNGVKPGEYDYVFAGATAQRYAALASGSIDATILAAPFNFKARSAGYSNLGATPDYVRDVPFSMFVVNVPWARQNRSIIDRFLAAYDKGVTWFYDPKNREEAIDVLQKRSKSDRADVEKTYDFFIALKVIDQSGVIETKGLGEILQVLKQQGDIEGTMDIGRFYDVTLGAKAR